MTDPQPRPTPRKPWWALLPEETRYKDTGCRLHPLCLNCPLPRCVEDVPRGKQHLQRAQVVALAKNLLARGCSQAQVAHLLGVSERTVRRYTDGCRSRNSRKKTGRRQPSRQRSAT